MAKAEFLRETREKHEGTNLRDLQLEIDYYLSCLMQKELDADEWVYDDLQTLLALRLIRCEKLVEEAGDCCERKAYEALVGQYMAIFRNPKTNQWMHIYCVDQVSYFGGLADGEKVKRWQEIAEAMKRIIQGG